MRAALDLRAPVVAFAGPLVGTCDLVLDWVPADLKKLSSLA